jgi:hypothetical protein
MHSTIKGLRRAKSRRPSAPAGCLYRLVPGWGWGLFSKCAGSLSGRTAPPWRSGPSAPRCWAAESAGCPKGSSRGTERPYGLRNYEIRYHRAVASLVVAPRVTDKQRLRDRRDQIYDTEIASKFADARNIRRPHPKSTEGFLSPHFARGVRLAEIDGINALRQIKVRGCYRLACEYLDGFIEIRSFNDIGSNAQGNISSEAQSSSQLGFQDYQDIEADLYGPGTIRIEEISPGRFNVYWNGTRPYKGLLIVKDSPRPVADAKEYLQREHINTGEIRVITLVEAKNRGRKPIGDKAMTTAERVRNHRAKFNACKPHRRTETDAVRPSAPSVADGVGCSIRRRRQGQR